MRKQYASAAAVSRGPVQPIAKWVEEEMVAKAGEGATTICNGVLTGAIG